MKKTNIMLAVCILLMAACSSNKETSTVKTDSLTLNDTANMAKEAITGKFSVVDTPKFGGPINLRFTVYNHADTAARFCKWHTPFERFMSKFLDVNLEDGAEAQYKGAMAKRMMPPPADAYITIKPGDSTFVDFNLADGYAIEKPGTYTIKYNAAPISGVVVKNALQFNLAK